MNNPHFQLKIDKDNNTILVEREFMAQLTHVWAAWTEAELLDQWWASEGWNSKTQTLVFEEGGMRHYLMTGPENAEHWGITTYEVIEKHKKFSGKECFSNEHAEVTDAFPVSRYSIRFEEMEGSTFIYHQSIYNKLADMEQSLEYGFEQGMLGAFARLDGYFGIYNSL